MNCLNSYGLVFTQFRLLPQLSVVAFIPCDLSRDKNIFNIFNEHLLKSKILLLTFIACYFPFKVIRGIVNKFWTFLCRVGRTRTHVLSCDTSVLPFTNKCRCHFWPFISDDNSVSFVFIDYKNIKVFEIYKIFELFFIFFLNRVRYKLVFDLHLWYS